MSSRCWLQLSSAAISSSWTTSAFTRSQASVKQSKRAVQLSSIFRRTARTSIRSNSSSPNSRRYFERRLPIPSPVYGQPSPPASKSSRRVNALHTSPTRDTVNLIVKCSSGAPALIDPDIAALGPPQLSKHLPKRRETDLRIRIALFASHQHADAPHRLALLRARRE